MKVKKMEIVEIYTSMLRAASLEVNSDGAVSRYGNNDEWVPLMVNGQRVILPTKQALSSPVSDQVIFFHPLSENLLLGESQMLSELRKWYCTKLNTAFLTIGVALLELTSNQENHRLLNPEQAELLSLLKDIDSNTAEAFVGLYTAMEKERTPDKVWLSVYLNKGGGALKEKSYRRAAIASFPVMEEWEKLSSPKTRVKDKAAFKRLFQFIFPELDVPNAYSRGSNSDISPFTDALMQTMMALMGRINAIVDLYVDVVPELASCRFDSDWVSAFDNIDYCATKIKMIPPLPGNNGKEKVTPLPVVNKPVINQLPPQSMTHQPYTPPQPTRQLPPQPAAHQMQPHQTPQSGMAKWRDIVSSNPALATGIDYANVPRMQYDQYGRPIIPPGFMVDGYGQLIPIQAQQPYGQPQQMQYPQPPQGGYYPPQPPPQNAYAPVPQHYQPPQQAGYNHQPQGYYPPQQPQRQAHYTPAPQTMPGQHYPSQPSSFYR